MINIPLALAKAADASFPTFVLDGKLCLRIRRTHARGGSNSTAEGGPLLVGAAALPAASADFCVGVVAAAGAAAGSFAVVASPESGVAGLIVYVVFDE